MNKYLSEEKFQSAKKKLVIIATVLLIVGLLVAGTLFVQGFSKKNKKVDTTNYETQIASLKQEISVLEQQRSAEFMTNGFSTLYYSLGSEIDGKTDVVIDLESKIFDAEHNKSYIGFFGGGAIVLLLTIGVSGIIYFIAFRRNIAAFGAQQVMPVAQEGLETMAPTFGKVSEEISKGISNGKSKNQK